MTSTTTTTATEVTDRVKETLSTKEATKAKGKETLTIKVKAKETSTTRAKVKETLTIKASRVI